MNAAEEPPGSEEETSSNSISKSNNNTSKKVSLTQLQTSQELSKGTVLPHHHHHHHQQQQQVHTFQQQQQGIGNSNPNDATTSGGFQQQQQQDSQQERRYRPQKFCAVCGDKAIACNFNAVTCESCKAFFRRNAFKEPRLKCLFDNRCIIDRVTRRFCSKCRLLKCFEIGMKREWILTDEQKQIKRVKIMQNKQSKQQQQLMLSASSKSSSCDESQLQQTSTATLHQQFIATTNAKRATSGGNGQLEQLADLSGGSGSVNCDQQSAYNSYVRSSGDKPASRQMPQMRGKVETRDATTSCDDPFELAFSNSNGSPMRAGGNQLLHCSLASQCQFCSLRLTGCFPAAQRNLQPQSASLQPSNPSTSTATSAMQQQQQQNQYTGSNNQQQPFDTSGLGANSSGTLNNQQQQYQAAATVYGPTSHQQQQHQQQPHLQVQVQNQTTTCSSCPPTPAKHLMRSNSGAANINQQQHMAQATAMLVGPPSFILSQATQGCCSLGQKSNSGLENQNLQGDLTRVKSDNYPAIWSDQIHLEPNECRNN